MNRNTAAYTARLLGIILFALSVNPLIRAQPSEAYDLVEAVNRYRISVGLPGLETSPALMVASQRHADWMVATFTHSHIGEGGSTPQSRASAAGFNGTVGENVGSSTTATPAEMIFFWDQSYIHKITMRSSLATHIGGGYAANSEERLFVLLIGTAIGQSPQPTSDPVAGGTPVIDYTPPPNMVWSTDGELHQGSDYIPASVNGQTSGGDSPRVAAAYVMPLDQIRLAEAGADGSIIHIVESGQTAWAIAVRYEVDLQDMLRLNHLSDRPVLRPGDKLIIRLGEGQSLPPAPAVSDTYTVQAGESLWTIAALYNRSVEELRAWNNLSENIIQPGMVLLISPPTPVPTVTVPPTLTPSPTSTPITATPTETGTPRPVVAMIVPTVAAGLPTPVLVEVVEQPFSQEQETGIRLLLILGILSAAVLVVWVGLLVYLARKSRRSS